MKVQAMARPRTVSSSSPQVPAAAAAYDHLRGRAERLLGTALPPTQRRWAGVYSQVTTGELYHRSRVAPGVVLVTGPGGRDMTCSPAIAQDSFELGEQD
jgi:hypothetical protein